MSPTTRLLLIVAGAFLLGCSTGDPYVPEADPELLRANRLSRAAQSLIVIAEQRTGTAVYPNIENFLEGPNPALALYREQVTRSKVVDFFVAKSGSETIALPILYYADRLDVPLMLAFSLVWVESRFRVNAVNRNAGSVDRGLFQLNSRTFPHLTEEDFFTPEVNAFHGLKYLQYCLKRGVDEAQALAIYNAGTTRVVAGRTPPSTLVYVERVLDYRARLEREFAEYILSHFPPAIA